MSSLSPVKGVAPESTATLQVAAIQQTCGSNKQQNLDASLAAIEVCAKAGARLVVLQELHATPYFCQTEETRFFDLAETIPGPTTDRIAAAAKALKVVIVASIFERRAPGLYHNTAVVFESTGEIAGIYRKMHIPDDPGFYEKFYFTPGDATVNASMRAFPGTSQLPASGFAPIQTSVGKLGVLVCWDQWYPEAARLMALAGAELLIYPTAIGWEPNEDEAEKKRQQEAWITIQRAHAIANGVHVIVPNRTGHEADPSGASEGIDFWGHSFICGPQGEFIATAACDKPENLIATLNMARSEAVRRIWPYLRDRRIDAYGELTKRYID